MKRVLIPLAIIVLAPLSICVQEVHAAWTEPALPVVTEEMEQFIPIVVSDGDGGAIAVWLDSRVRMYDIYAQRIGLSGEILWAEGGVPICTRATYKVNHKVIPDGVGGAIITWEESDGSGDDIYAQRIDASGAVQWATGGAVICGAAGSQFTPELAPDGTGGAIIAWQDDRGATPDIFAQRIDASGTVQWAVDGVAVCATTGVQATPRIAPDGSGGAYIVWEDYRGADCDIYAQNIDDAGAAQWAVNGVVVSAAALDQYRPRVLCDGAGGAIFVWQDYRNNEWDLYGQRFDAAGTAQWAANGAVLSNAMGDQTDARIVSDGAGGAVVCWFDTRNSDDDIYALRIDDTGTALWYGNGEQVTITGDQRNGTLVSDGGGGAIITWEDITDYPKGRVCVQRLDAAGAPGWDLGGIPLCGDFDTQYLPSIATDGSNGAIIAWGDYRSGEYDVYAQRVDSRGVRGYELPAIHSALDVPGDQGGYVNLAWDATPLDYDAGEIGEYTLWRAIDTPEALGLVESGARVVSNPSAVIEVLTGPRAVTRDEGARTLLAGSLAGQPYYWEHVGTKGAYRLQGYAMAVETLFDSTAVCDQYHYFQVIAHTADPFVHYVSFPDSGYSVDNLAPCAPLGLAGEQSFTPAGLELAWSPSVESDLDGYRVYRGESPGFEPEPGNLLSSVCDTTLFDGGWTWDSGYCYKVSAVDVHGNESGHALLCSDAVTGDEPASTPRAAFLAQNHPNPFNPHTRIFFGLGEEGHVALHIFDAAGRPVVTLVDEHRPAGRYTAEWDGRTSRGACAASGVYFYRLLTGSFSRTRKMILLR